jgi:hypothetical protein
MTNTYGAQEAQDRVPVTVVVDGFENWRDALAEEQKLNAFWAKIVGADVATREETAIAVAGVNRISREVALFSSLMNLGYVLEEIKVSFPDSERSVWGICSWIKDHPSYSNPENIWRKLEPDATDHQVGLVSSMFATECCGEQQFTLTSTAIAPGFLFHKSIVFHRVVFSKQNTEAKKAA